jgi:phosphoribosyl 1,2-cyclic phosphodiesterase
MKIKFYGVRGSLPVCSKEFLRYGGNTTCMRIYRETANRIVIIDAGTGIRNLGKELMAQHFRQELINISFTHFHWDHIQGFPFFAPAYNKNQKIGILVMGRERKHKNLKEIFSLQLQADFFPVGLDAMGARFEFPSLDDKGTFYGANVIAAPQYHKFRGGSYGLRIEDDSKILVICTDLEHIDGIDESIVELAKDADLLIHDGQYTADEYKKYKGWGHSTWQDAVAVAKRAKVKKLIITHHDPDHDDDFLDAMEKECKEIFPDSLFAKEGMEVSV